MEIKLWLDKMKCWCLLITVSTQANKNMFNIKYFLLNMKSTGLPLEDTWYLMR